MKHKVLQLGISVCVAAALMSDAFGAQSASEAGRMTALIRAASDQFELAYRSSPSEARLRHEELKSVIAAWRAAPRDQANNELLATWLRAAIRSSMPGSRAGLPPVPTFVLAKHEEHKERTVSKPVAKELRPRVAEPAANEVKSVAVATSTADTKTPEPTPVMDAFDQTLDAALADPFRDDPEDEQHK